MKILRSVCEENTVHSSSDNQEKLDDKIAHLNTILNDLFQQWAKNLSEIRQLSVSIIQFTLPTASDQLNLHLTQLLSTFQTGAILHCGSLNNSRRLIRTKILPFFRHRFG